MKAVFLLLVVACFVTMVYSAGVEDQPGSDIGNSNPLLLNPLEEDSESKFDEAAGTEQGARNKRQFFGGYGGYGGYGRRRFYGGGYGGYGGRRRFYGGYGGYGR